MRFALILLFAVSCHAHMMSMSSGDAVLEGRKLTYTLTMPLYEIAHTASPEQSLFSHITFENAQLTSHECQAKPARDSYICHATYQFATVPETLSVHCTFFEVTVPNHVHLLRATYGAEPGAKRDQAVFDSVFTAANLRFRPPTEGEKAAKQVLSAAARVVTGLAPILLLVTLALAASNWHELAVLSGFFLAGEFAGSLLPWQPGSLFLEAAAALAVAYLAVEVLFLPSSRARWIVAAVLGFVPGLVLAGYIRQSDSLLLYAFAGTAGVDLAVLWGTAALAFAYPKTRRIPAALCLATSLCWFVLAMSR